MIEPEAVRLADDGEIPNSALPLLVYRGALADCTAGAVQQLFQAHGWGDSWVDGIFGHHHYHSTAHEVLGMIAGWCEVRVGGPNGRTLRVETGDVVVVPAGVAHCNVGQGDGFRCFGAYPAGQRPDLCRPGDRAKALRNLPAVPLPAQDPVHGREGPLRRAWAA